MQILLSTLLCNISEQIEIQDSVMNKKRVSRGEGYWKTVLQLPHDFNWKQVWNFKIKKIPINKYKEFSFKLIYNIFQIKLI